MKGKPNQMAAISRDELTNELARLRQERDQLIANLNGCLGKIQLCEQLLTPKAAL